MRRSVVTICLAPLSILLYTLNTQAAVLQETPPTVALTERQTSANCFPFGTARLNGLHKPGVSRSSWWCPPNLQYGFMGWEFAERTPRLIDLLAPQFQLSTREGRLRRSEQLVGEDEHGLCADEAPVWSYHGARLRPTMQGRDRLAESSPGRYYKSDVRS